MDELIKFRLHADALNELEFRTLFGNITDIIGKEALLSGLFHHYHKHLKDELEINTLKKLNTTISKIIETTLTLKPQLDCIADCNINHIASYLDFISYCKFEKCNRSIFIASHTPYQLHECDIWYLSMYVKYYKNRKNANMRRFDRVRTLTFFPKGYNNDYWSSVTIWSKLSFQNLRILEVHLNDNNMSALSTSISNNNMRLDKLIGLKLSKDESNIQEMSKIVNVLLTKTSKLQWLRLSYNKEAPIIESSNQCIIQNLNGLALIGWGTMCTSDIVVKMVGDIHELSFLHINCNFEFSKLRLPTSLTELRVESSQYMDWNDVLFNKINELQRLRKFSLNFIHRYQTNMECSTDDLVSMCSMNKLLALPELQVFELVILEKNLLDLFDVIKNALMKHKKEELKVCIKCQRDTDRYSRYCNDALGKDLSAMVYDLKRYTEHFMFVFDFAHFRGSGTSLQVVKDWFYNLDKSLYSCYEPTVDRWVAARFVVTNHECKLQGFDIQWIIS